MGPTGSGKTPLGAKLEERGIRGCRVVHFDFGACLRSAGSGPAQWPLLDSSDLGVIRSSLESGVLLEDREFPVALKILQTFIGDRSVKPGDLIVMNGLPRHIGQAGSLEKFVRVSLVIFLDCPPEILIERIRLDIGRDRSGREDDSEEDVLRRWGIFQQRTIPLLDHYLSKGAKIIKIPVSSKDTGDTLFAALTDRAEISSFR